MEKKEIKQRENLDETVEKIIGAAPDKEEPRPLVPEMSDP